MTMVYHRNAWNYYVVGGLIHGLFRGGLFKTGSLHEVVQFHTDGAIARYYSESEWRTLASEFLDVHRIQVAGPKSHLLPLPGGRLKRAAAALIPAPLGRFFTHTCKCGLFLVSSLSSRS